MSHWLISSWFKASGTKPFLLKALWFLLFILVGSGLSAVGNAIESGCFMLALHRCAWLQEAWGGGESAPGKFREFLPHHCSTGAAPPLLVLSQSGCWSKTACTLAVLMLPLWLALVEDFSPVPSVGAALVRRTGFVTAVFQGEWKPGFPEMSLQLPAPWDLKGWWKVLLLFPVLRRGDVLSGKVFLLTITSNSLCVHG